MKFKTYYQLNSEFCSLGSLSNTLGELVEICRTELLDFPRTTEKAQDLILEWFNNKKDKPMITEHRLSYFGLYYLRKEFNKKRRLKK